MREMMHMRGTHSTMRGPVSSQCRVGHQSGGQLSPLRSFLNSGQLPQPTAMAARMTTAMTTATAMPGTPLLPQPTIMAARRPMAMAMAMSGVPLLHPSRLGLMGKGDSSQSCHRDSLNGTPHPGSPETASGSGMSERHLLHNLGTGLTSSSIPPRSKQTSIPQPTTLHP